MTPTISPPQAAAMRNMAREVSALLRVLGNADRLLLLCQLGQGEQCVGELESALGIHQPTLSQQLTVLRSENLVNTRRESKRIYYSVADPRVLQLLQTLHAVYCPSEGESDVD
jgi:DNA-binding transcriptional ArsR family regulator